MEGRLYTMTQSERGRAIFAGLISNQEDEPVEVTYLGDFLPPPGEMMLEVTVDRTRYDRLLVTVEPLGSTPSEPGEPAWGAA